MFDVICDGTTNENGTATGGTSEGGGGAHVPQIVLDRNELSRQGQILVLSSHEAYETLHRVRLLSFLLLAYSTLQILRDVAIYLAPPDGYDGNNDVIPPGDPTDTQNTSYAEEDELPEWEDRDYVELKKPTQEVEIKHRHQVTVPILLSYIIILLYHIMKYLRKYKIVCLSNYNILPVTHIP